MAETKQKSPMIRKIILPLLILALGFISMNLMLKMKKVPTRKPSIQQGVPVTVRELEERDHQLIIKATGTVQAQQNITLVPEVSGKVNWIAPALVSGGLFKSGESLLTIEDRDYQLAVDQARAEVAKAEVALAKEKELARIAMQEWLQIKLPDKGEPGPLVTHEIQLQQEKAALAAAEAGLQRALLNLERTTIRAPFNGRIVAEQVDLGQYLRAGTSIATFSGTDRAEIHVQLAEEQLQWLKIPAAGKQAGGSAAIIRVPGNPEASRQGRITRSLGEIDPLSRMATLVISVTDPYLLQGTSQTERPLLNGQFVELELYGKSLSRAISIPREALQPNDVVWVAGPDNRLQQRQVKIAHRNETSLLLTKGVKAGERLILTNLSAAAEGTLLRPLAEEQGQ